MNDNTLTREEKRLLLTLLGSCDGYLFDHILSKSIDSKEGLEQASSDLMKIYCKLNRDVGEPETVTQPASNFLVQCASADRMMGQMHLPHTDKLGVVKAAIPQCLQEIEPMNQSLCGMRICTTIPPEEKHTINDALKAHGLHESGTRNGWVLDESVEPVPCRDHPGRWHYVLIC